MLSKPWEQRKKQYDFVVVGSGYGGAITAARLAKAELHPAPSVCVLERGREWQIGKFPDTFDAVLAESRDKSYPLGLYEILRYPDLSVLKGCGLGGTSLINANVAAIPDAEVFELPDWPRSLTLRTLEPYMQQVKRILGAQPDPRAPNFKKVQAMDRRAQQIGKRAEPMQLAVNHSPVHFNPHGMLQRPCLGCGDCTTGCNHHSKNTLYMNYLPMARNAGADIFIEKQVKWIEKRPDGGWRIHGERHDAGLLDRRFRIDAANVILAAGSVHSTEILLRSQMQGLSLSSALGTRFSCNGDFFGMSYNGDFQTHVTGFGNHPDSPVARNPPGPAIVSGIHYNSGLPLKHRIHVEDYSVPSAYVRAAKKAFALLKGEDTDTVDEAEEERRRRLDRKLRSYQPDGALNHTMVYMAMSYDDARGKMILNKPNGEIEIVWDDAGRQPVYTRISEELRRHARAQGGSYIPNPLWDLFEMRRLMTVHPLGGCPLGEDPNEAVVDEYGRVFSGAGEVHDGLFVADGAIVPTSVGINPFVTISALAERIAERKIRAVRGDPYPAHVPMLRVDVLGPEVLSGEEAELEKVFVRRPGYGAEALRGLAQREVDGPKHVIRSGSLWKGFFPKDHVLSTLSAPIFKGFKKEFVKDGDKLSGVTSDLDDGFKVRHEIEEISIEKRTRELEPGRYLLLRYLDPPWRGHYELLKVIHEDLAVGRAYAGEYPNGTRVHTFAISRHYSIEQMTPGDHQALYENGLAPSAEDLKGTWRMDLISVVNRAETLAYLRFDVDAAGGPACGCRMAGLLEGLLVPESFVSHFRRSDLTSIKDEFRCLNRDYMVGKFATDLDGEQAEMLRALGLLHSDQERLSYRFSLTRVEKMEYPTHTVFSPYLSVQLPDGVELVLEEEMVGWHHPGEVPTEKSAAGGGPDAGVDCRLRLQLTVRDVNEFVDGSAHEARVAGSLSITKLDGDKNLVLEIDPYRSSFKYQQLGPNSDEAQVCYQLQFTPKGKKRLLLQGSKFFRKDDNGGAGSQQELLEDFTAFYGSLNETVPETKEIGAIFLKSKTAQDQAVPGNLESVFRSWRVTGTDDPVLQLYAKMRILAFASPFLRLECDPAVAL